MPERARCVRSRSSDGLARRRCVGVDAEDELALDPARAEALEGLRESGTISSTWTESRPSRHQARSFCWTASL